MGSDSDDFDELLRRTVRGPDCLEEYDAFRHGFVRRITEAEKLREEVRSRQPPKLQLTLPTKLSAQDLHKENVRRNRIPSTGHALRLSSTTGKPLKVAENPRAVVAPSVTVQPLPAERMPSFDEVLTELGVPAASGNKPVYMTDCRIISEAMLKDLVKKRAEILVKKMESTKVDRGTQTYVSQAGKQYVAGCVNCRSTEHHFKNCQLSYRPDFCHVCGADGFDTKDCIYPHGIEHEYALNRCAGCSRDLSLYCPECPDCNIRYEGISDWLRLNYATWPTWMIPKDHQYLVGEGEEFLRRKVKAKFDAPGDFPNRLRQFLIRENALAAVDKPANPEAKSARQLSEDKRKRAVQALSSPFVSKTLDEVMRERPELQDGEEIKIIVPSKYKKPAK